MSDNVTSNFSRYGQPIGSNRTLDAQIAEIQAAIDAAELLFNEYVSDAEAWAIAAAASAAAASASADAAAASAASIEGDVLDAEAAKVAAEAAATTATTQATTATTQATNAAASATQAQTAETNAAASATEAAASATAADASADAAATSATAADTSADEAALYAAQAAAAVAGALAWEAGVYVNGKPDASETIVRHEFKRNVRFATNLASWDLNFGTAPTSSFVVSVKKNGTEFGTITAAATTGAITLSGTQTDMASGDILTVVCPTPQDTTAADFGLAMNGTRL
jgi:hypothetical protein